MSARDRARTVVVMVDSYACETVIGHLVADRPDLALVDALAQVQLEAGRLGCSIRLRHPCRELVELLSLVGLEHFVGEPPSAVLAAEPDADRSDLGAPEQREGSELEARDGGEAIGRCRAVFKLSGRCAEDTP